nr:MFS transporter [Sphingomonas colocasiae]
MRDGRPAILRIPIPKTRDVLHMPSNANAAIPRSSHVPARAWYALTVLTLGAVLSYTDRYIINVLVDGIKRDLHLDDVAISLVQGAAFAIVYAFAAIAFGTLADRLNRRNILFGGTALWSAGMLGCGLAENYGQLVFFRSLVGIGEASFFPASLSILAAVFPAERRGLAFGALLMGSAIGTGAAVSIGGGLLAFLPSHLDWPFLPGGSSWRGVLVILAAAGPVLMLLILSVREPARVATAAEGARLSTATLLGLLRTGGVVLLALAMVSVADAAASAWAPTFFSRLLHFTPARIAAEVGTAAIVAGGAGYLAGGILSDYLDARGVRNARDRVALGASGAALIGLSFVMLRGGAAVAAYALFVFAIASVSVAGASAFLRRLSLGMQGFGTALLAFTMVMSGLGSGPTIVALVKQHMAGGEAATGLAILLVGGGGLLAAMVMFAWQLRRGAADGVGRPVHG